MNTAELGQHALTLLKGIHRNIGPFARRSPRLLAVVFTSGRAAGAHPLIWRANSSKCRSGVDSYSELIYQFGGLLALRANTDCI